MTLKLVTTSDGSHSLLNTELDETYHSKHGAIQESVHVFIKNGIEHYAASHFGEDIKVLEVGFGTGLNVLLTIMFSRAKPFAIDYSSLESSPLDEQTALGLNYPSMVGKDAAALFSKLHTTPWDHRSLFAPNFFLTKRRERLQEAFLGSEQFDVIYFDAFAPGKQPEMWELDIISKVEISMRPGGVFVTYCAKGQLKRDLRSLGMSLETLPGPPEKKEMVRATKVAPKL